jgi:hypothetical protein
VAGGERVRPLQRAVPWEPQLLETDYPVCGGGVMERSFSNPSADGRFYHRLRSRPPLGLAGPTTGPVLASCQLF